MQQEGVLPEHVVAAMGPAIGACCFAVGSEVVAAFAALPWFRPEIVIQDAGGPRIDLYAAIRLQLLAAGLHTHHIYTSDMCTVCHPVDCYSWRRDRGQTGRHLAMIQRRYS
jgi:copper oxidase (laccase) domain-containing protein